MFTLEGCLVVYCFHQWWYQKDTRYDLDLPALTRSSLPLLSGIALKSDVCSVCNSVRDDITVSAIKLWPLRGRASTGIRRALLGPAAKFGTPLLFAVDNRWIKLGWIEIRLVPLRGPRYERNAPMSSPHRLFSPRHRLSCEYSQNTRTRARFGGHAARGEDLAFHGWVILRLSRFYHRVKCELLSMKWQKHRRSQRVAFPSNLTRRVYFARFLILRRS